MSSLEPRRGSGMSRSSKERLGYRLVMVGGVAGIVTVLGAILAIAGVLGWGLPFIGAIIAVICWVWFRRLVRPS
jgi:hypothetical protein